MRNIVLDNSAVSPWLRPIEGLSEADRLRRSEVLHLVRSAQHQDKILVPANVLAETLAGLNEDDQAFVANELRRATNITVASFDHRAASVFGRLFKGLDVPEGKVRAKFDLQIIAIAQRWKGQLITYDDRQRKRAERAGVVAGNPLEVAEQAKAAPTPQASQGEQLPLRWSGEPDDA